MLEAPSSWPYGFEVAGRVVAVGAGGDRFSVGDAVVAGPVEGGLGSHVLARASHVAARPAALPAEGGAALPIAYLTASCALHELGRIGRGDRVLIHAAAGGVGLAAVNLAARAGAEVYATASRGKWDVLRSRGVAAVADSRSPDFATAIRAAAGARGVDLVLNSLSGEMIPRSLELLVEGGRFVEIGKVGTWAPERVAAIRPDVAYTILDLREVDRERPGLLPRLLGELLAAVADGSLPPLPVRSFPGDRVADAFRFMAQARHVGKIVIDLACLGPGLHEPAASADDAAIPGAAVSSWCERLRELPGEERRAAIVGLVRDEVARTLGLDDPSEVKTGVEFCRFGFDSLMGVELKTRLERRTGRLFASTLIFDFPTIERIADHLAATLDVAAGEWTGPPPPGPALAPGDAEAMLLSELDELGL